MIYQIIVLILVTMGFITNLYHTYYGREESEPTGFWGSITLIFFYTLIILLYYKAGLFRELF